MRRILGKIVPVLLAASLLVLVPASTLAIDIEHRDLLQNIDDNTSNILIGKLTTTQLQNTDAVVKVSAGWLGGFLIITNGTNDATLILYDDPDDASSGVELAKWIVAGGDNCGGVMFPFPVEATTGIFGDIEGDGANWIAYYQ